ncbi:MAG: cobalamin biosynthesis protein CbiD [Parasporobacterium sp.]|nr:cobalamin biosynthesis protein CbiD [Parasporobacterium sp.]
MRLGYTTGSCAAAAAKAAAWMLLTGQRKENIKLLTPKGIWLDLQVCDIDISADHAGCAIVKDSGDDPDVTDGTKIAAEVSFIQEPEIRIDGGTGIGRVTRRGLDQPVGNAAINSVPRRMIMENLGEVMALTDYHGGLSVVISAPEGEALAGKTFNSRLGITGGISILGTTGIVEPMSEQAIVDTIRTELTQRKADGAEYILLTPGNYGEEYIRNHTGLDPSMAVMTSNYIGDSLDICAELGFSGALLVGHIGKLVKLAGNMMNTHSKYGDCRAEIMAAYAGAANVGAEVIERMLECVTCDDIIRILAEEGKSGEVLQLIRNRIGYQMDQRVRGKILTGAVLFSREYGFLCETDKAGMLMQNLIQEQEDRI